MLSPSDRKMSAGCVCSSTGIAALNHHSA